MTREDVKIFKNLSGKPIEVVIMENDSQLLIRVRADQTRKIFSDKRSIKSNGNINGHSNSSNGFIKSCETSTSICDKNGETKQGDLNNTFRRFRDPSLIKNLIQSTLIIIRPTIILVSFLFLQIYLLTKGNIIESLPSCLIFALLTKLIFNILFDTINFYSTEETLIFTKTKRMLVKGSSLSEKFKRHKMHNNEFESDEEYFLLRKTNLKGTLEKKLPVKDLRVAETITKNKIVYSLVIDPLDINRIDLRSYVEDSSDENQQDERNINKILTKKPIDSTKNTAYALFVGIEPRLDCIDYISTRIKLFNKKN